MAVALRRLEGSPFRAEAGSALRKLVAAMQTDDAAAARDLAGRVHLLGNPDPGAGVPRVLADALSARRVLRIGYEDRGGAATTREIEPLGYVIRENSWYLVAWCRQRAALRVFRTDRITSISVTAEVPPHRPLSTDDLDVPQGCVTQLSLG
jgi:predicted DNA-binding transcriptional regulator YafY